MREVPLKVINNLIKEKYKEARAVFWSGSVSRGLDNPSSDLDLVIIYEKIPNAYRETFIFNDWPIDAFIHDTQTLEYFFEEVDKQSLTLALPHMIVNSIEVPKVTEFGNNIKIYAENIINSLPLISQSDFCNRQFKIVDLLDDLKDNNIFHEQISITFQLYKELAEVYLLSNGKWLGSGKYLARNLKDCNQKMARKFELAFSENRNFKKIYSLAQIILKPIGGLFWDGFRSDAPESWRSVTIELEPDIILNEPVKQQVRQAIYKGLKAFNQSKVGPYASYPYSIHIKSEEGEIIAGLRGDIFGSLSRVSSLWVDEKHRKKSIGRRIINALANYSINQGCEIIQLDTADFQAKGFYEKCGFIPVAILEKNFIGHTGYIMRKYLTK